jgi:hypothetical protein
VSYAYIIEIIVVCKREIRALGSARIFIENSRNFRPDEESQPVAFTGSAGSRDSRELVAGIF